MTSKIEEALNKSTDTEVILAISDFIYKKCTTEEKFERLNKSEKTVIYIDILEAQVNNGGFDQYFFNSTGDDANEALEAYKDIGSTTTANIVHRAIELFPISPVPKSTQARRDLMAKLDPSITEGWNKLDDEFYKYDEDVTHLLIDFVKKNILDFK